MLHAVHMENRGAVSSREGEMCSHVWGRDVVEGVIRDAELREALAPTASWYRCWYSIKNPLALPIKHAEPPRTGVLWRRVNRA